MKGNKKKTPCGDFCPGDRWPGPWAGDSENKKPFFIRLYVTDRELENKKKSVFLKKIVINCGKLNLILEENNQMIQAEKKL